MQSHLTRLLSILLPVVCFLHGDRSLAQNERLGIQQLDNQLVFSVDQSPVAAYVFQDDNIPRPYFAHIKSIDGTQVSRNHPPIEGVDRTDHDTMHPGIWLAFGDLDGEDFWRNKASVKHIRFSKGPKLSGDKATFTEIKHYLRPDKSLVCSERFACGIHLLKYGFLLTWDSSFSSDRPFYFGDQEEMGLGIRVATSISELKDGQLSDSSGRKGAKAIWSQAARWCRYSSLRDGRHQGMAIFCHPDNFRSSWMHARNYGFVAANAFGRKAMQKGEASRVVVQPGDELRLRYAVWVFSSQQDPEMEIEAAYESYLKLSH